MIDGLIAGKVYGQPERRQAKNGNDFATAKVRAPAANGESVFVSVIAFDAVTMDALLALDDGDSVALSGTLAPTAWTDKNGEAKAGLSMTAHAVLTPYHVQRKRQAMQGGQSDE